MDEKEFLREKEKLKEVCEKLETEERELEKRLAKTDSSYEVDVFENISKLELFCTNNPD